MDIEEDLKILEKFNPGDEYTERIKSAIEHLLAEREKDKKRIEELEDENRIQRHQIMQVFDRGYIHKDKIKDEYIPKQKVEEELEKAEKENEPYERHNKESRMYWINQGKISLAKKLLEDK